jgi:hypothetical protein
MRSFFVAALGHTWGEIYEELKTAFQNIGALSRVVKGPVEARLNNI